MKTIFYSLAVFLASFFMIANASAQYGPPPPPPGAYPPADNRCGDDRRQSFYYYPQSNVYYSFSTGNYIFANRNSWVMADRLPRYYRLRREPHFVVYHNGADVWNDNRFHRMKYHDYSRYSPDVTYDHRGGNDEYGYPDRNDNRRR